MKNVAPLLPWIGLAVGLAALFLGEKQEEKRAFARGWLMPLAMAALAVAAALLLKGELRIALFWFAGAAFGATVASFLVDWRRTTDFAQTVAALGLTAFLVGSSGMLALESLPRLGGLVVGIAVAALPSLALSGNRVALLLACVLFPSGVIALLARMGYREEVRQAAPLVVWAALLAFVLGWAVRRALEKRGALLAPTFSVAALAGLAWLALGTYLGEGDAAFVGLVSVVGLLLTAWAVPLDRPSVATWGLAAVIWLGLATFAFSTAFGLGMATAGFFGVATALLIRRKDLLPPVGIVVGLAAYRLFRENNVEVVRAFDIGQHYAMIGFVLGIMVLVAFVDALVQRRASWGAGIQGALIGLIAAAIVVGAGAFFGPKGAVGIFVGLAVAPMVAQLGAARPAWSFVAAAALQCAVLVTYRPLSWQLDLDREGKVRLLVWLSLGILVLYGALWWLVRQKREGARANV